MSLNYPNFPFILTSENNTLIDGVQSEMAYMDRANYTFQNILYNVVESMQISY